MNKSVSIRPVRFILAIKPAATLAFKDLLVSWGENAIDCTLGQNCMLPPPVFSACLAEVSQSSALLRELSIYQPGQGRPSLRGAIADYHTKLSRETISPNSMSLFLFSREFLFVLAICSLSSRRSCFTLSKACFKGSILLSKFYSIKTFRWSKIIIVWKNMLGMLFEIASIWSFFYNLTLLSFSLFHLLIFSLLVHLIFFL